MFMVYFTMLPLKDRLIIMVLMATVAVSLMEINGNINIMHGKNPAPALVSQAPLSGYNTLM